MTPPHPGPACPPTGSTVSESQPVTLVTLVTTLLVDQEGSEHRGEEMVPSR